MESNQINLKCIFCASDLGQYTIITTKNEKAIKWTPLCVNCMGGGSTIVNKDLKIINEGWNKGGFLIPNQKVNPQGELLLKLLQKMLNEGEIQVKYIDNKTYLESNNLAVEIKIK